MALGDWVEFTGGKRILKLTIPSSQGWAPNICQSYASLLNVVVNICDGLSSPVNSFILIILLLQSFILQHILNYNYGLLSLITYDGLCRL